MEADDSEADSAFYNDSIASSSTSLRSEITKYIYEYGRRYHGYKAGHYLYPNDEGELERMDIEHQNQLLQFDSKLHLAPLNAPQQILDLGTGSGIWCIDMADEYPSAEVIGTDLAPIQPEWVPPNCKFEIDDYEQEWTWGSNRFDLVHYRFLIGSVTDWTLLYQRIYDAVKPGGWFEISDMDIRMCCDDGTVPDDANCVQWANHFYEAISRLGRRIPRVRDYKRMFEEAGFVDVHEQILVRPTNDWPKDPRMKQIGAWSHLNYMHGLQGFTLVPFSRALGWSEAEIEIFIAGIRNEWRKRNMHGYHEGIKVWGRKPLDARTTNPIEDLGPPQQAPSLQLPQQPALDQQQHISQWQQGVQANEEVDPAQIISFQSTQQEETLPNPPGHATQQEELAPQPSVQIPHHNEHEQQHGEEPKQPSANQPHVVEEQHYGIQDRDRDAQVAGQNVQEQSVSALQEQPRSVPNTPSSFQDQHVDRHLQETSHGRQASLTGSQGQQLESRNTKTTNDETVPETVHR